jgi:hypothetical protein
MIDRDSSSTSPRVNPAWIQAGIVIAFTAYSISLFWYFGDRSPEWLQAVLAGAWAIQAHLFATWAALGPGKFIIRLPPVIAGLLIVLGAPGVHPDGLYDIEHREFLALVLTTTSIVAIATVLLLVVRRFVGWRIERHAPPSQRDASRYQFNTRYLIGMITLYAVMLGIYTNVVFKSPDPPAPFNIFGPDFVIHIIVVGGATMAALLLPIIAVPLFVLNTHYSKRAVYFSMIVWAIITAAVTTFWQTIEGEGLGFLVMALAVQAGAGVMGILTALPLRFAGYRVATRAKRLSQDAN